MGMMAETYLLQAINNGLSSIRQTPSQLADILTALNANELNAAEQWFGNANNKIYIAPGFPMAPEQLPFIGVTVAGEEMIDSQVGIGYDYYSTKDSTTGQITQIRGARFSGSIKATIYTPNADLIVWISAIVKWSLLSQLDWFGEDSGGGFNNIVIGLGDFEPQPGFLPIFTFARGVFFKAEYDQTFTEQPQSITSANISGTFNAFVVTENQ